MKTLEEYGLYSFVRDLGSRRNNYELIIVLQNSLYSFYIKKQLLLPYNFYSNPSSRWDWNFMWVTNGFWPLEILISGIIVASLLGKERNSILIVKTWVWVSWVELDSLMPISSIIVGSSINLLVVHKWYSSSRGGLALKSERDSWYQRDGAAVIELFQSLEANYVLVCASLCVIPGSGADTAIAVAGVSAAVTRPMIFFISLCRKNAKTNHKILHINKKKKYCKNLSY